MGTNVGHGRNVPGARDRGNSLGRPLYEKASMSVIQNEPATFATFGEVVVMTFQPGGADGSGG